MIDALERLVERGEHDVDRLLFSLLRLQAQVPEAASVGVYDTHERTLVSLVSAARDVLWMEHALDALLPDAEARESFVRYLHTAPALGWDELLSLGDGWACTFQRSSAAPHRVLVTVLHAVGVDVAAVMGQGRDALRQILSL